ncbi:Chloramphenicol acetyltransferase-like domain-containing protein [Artemisia annua]|uniref:Chloramphenicol acetyltransferase-like domain-containing protein n=1 Tax=Artemisia annua TaxID=35608 RepID=A0A2U1MKQ6_ARTAN|nr:Chloramphenicol acetyltransferase-like domain-containing protein [Artemisia annua]
MAFLPILKVVLEKSQVSPPRATIDTRSLPLTFFDISWLPFSPVHNLFVYEFPITKTHFVETIVPNLKHYLSITLQLFSPFVGNLILFPTPNKPPKIRYTEGDFVPVTFAECTLDFNDLTGNHPRDWDKFYPLILSLDTLQNTRFRFPMAWTSIARSGTNESFLAKGDFPLHDRLGDQNYHQFLEETRISTNSNLTIACAYILSCIAKSRNNELQVFGIIIDCRTRLVPTVPSNYFGNCLATCGTMEITSVLIEKDGFVTAAKLLGE